LRVSRSSSFRNYSGGFQPGGVKRNSPPPAPEAQSPNGPRQGRRRHSLDFALFILLNAILFIRPAEIVPAIHGLPIYEVVILSCLAVSSSAVLAQLTPRSLRKSPINTCVFGVLGSVILSLLSHFLIADAILSGIEFLKTLLYYLLLVSVLDSFERLRKFLLWLCFFVVVLTSLALLHYHEIVNIPALEAYHEGQDMVDEETGEPVVLARLQSVGIYGNPNDLSRILVVGILLSIYWLGDRRLGLLRPLCLLPMALFGHGLHLTHSRGGLLSFFAGLIALFYTRYGRAKTLLVGSLIIPIFLVAFAGRQTNMSTSEGTGQQRIKLWNEGFVAMRSSPVFGIGMNRYEEEAGLVAHNSFVHCYVELGFVGGTFFFAMFYLPAMALRNRDLHRTQGLDSELMRLAPFIFAVLIATVVGMLSSTRSYAIPTYLIVGLSTAYLKILSDRGHALLPRFNSNLVSRVSFASALTLVTFYFYVRLVARY